MTDLSKFLLRTATAIGVTAGVVLGFSASAEAVEIQSVTSPGGIKALLVEDYTNPLIAMKFSFKGGGTTQDEPGKEGTSNLLSGLLDEGAGDIKSAAFQEKLDDLGVSMGFDAGYDSFDGGFRTLVKNEDAAFDLLRLALSAPRFDEEPVARIRAQIATGIIANRDDPGQRASEAWRNTVFPNHPYARPIEGTLETLKAVTPDDLRSYMRRSLARDNLYIGVVGAIDPVSLGKKLDEIFGALPAHADLRPVPDVAPVTGKSVAVNLDVPQTMIQFALPGVARHDKDFFAAYLMNEVLGGGSSNSRLYSDVREKRGLAYSVSSYLATFDHAAVLGISTATRAAKAEETIDIIRKDLEKLASDGPTAEELQKVKDYVKGTYLIHNLDSSLAIASTLVGIQLDNLGIDYIDRRKDLIDAVTLDEVKAQARKLLSAEPTIITVGSAGA